MSYSVCYEAFVAWLFVAQVIFVYNTFFPSHRTFIFFVIYERRQVQILIGQIYITLHFTKNRQGFISIFIQGCGGSLRNPVVTGVDFFDGLPHSQTFHLEFIYLCTNGPMNMIGLNTVLIFIIQGQPVSLEWTHPHYFRYF